jgi:hypothetical protein
MLWIICGEDTLQGCCVRLLANGASGAVKALEKTGRPRKWDLQKKSSDPLAVERNRGFVCLKGGNHNLWTQGNLHRLVFF